jgi:predicted flavoprotein YhiN
MKDNEQITNHLTTRLAENNCRTNEVLSEQIAIIQELAPQLDTNDLKQLEASLGEIAMALNKLKEFMKYLPK